MIKISNKFVFHTKKNNVGKNEIQLQFKERSIVSDDLLRGFGIWGFRITHLSSAIVLGPFPVYSRKYDLAFVIKSRDFLKWIVVIVGSS